MLIWLQPFCKQHLFVILLIKNRNKKFCVELQTTIILFTRNASSHKTDWIPTTRCPLCFAYLYAPVFSLMKVLEVERSGFLLLDNSFATLLVGAYCSCCLICVRLHLSLFLMQKLLVCLYQVTCMLVCIYVMWIYTAFWILYTISLNRLIFYTVHPSNMGNNTFFRDEL